MIHLVRKNIINKKVSTILEIENYNVMSKTVMP